MCCNFERIILENPAPILRDFYQAKATDWTQAGNKFIFFLYAPCPHYDPEQKICDIYEDRPQVCRDFPISESFVQDCGFYWEEEDADL
jgi:Fe-S-cluster containining protein